MRWIAGTGQIIPVIIIGAGTGGHSPKYVPPDPVIVRSVEDHHEFVASESCLYTDRTAAIIEARRLKENERRSNAAKSLAAMLTPTSPVLPGSSSDTLELVVGVSTESIDTQEEEEAVTGDGKPQKLIDRILSVIGSETITFDEICTRLQKRHWMPKRRSSVSNALSAHKNLFNCPSRGTYSLGAKPKVNPPPNLEDDPSNDTLELGVLQSLGEGEEDEEAKEEEDEEEEDEEDEDEDEGDEQEAEEDEEDAPSQSEAETEFAIWMNQSMQHLTSTHAHYRDGEVVLSEKQRRGKWHAEIYVQGIELWCEGRDEDRSVARMTAEDQLRSKVSKISQIIGTLGC
jgi:hypothetical protein